MLVAIAGAASLAAFAVSGAATVWSIASGVLAAIGTVIGVIISPIGLLVAAVAAAGAAWLYFSGVRGTVVRWFQTRFVGAGRFWTAPAPPDASAPAP